MINLLMFSAQHSVSSCRLDLLFCSSGQPFTSSISLSLSNQNTVWRMEVPDSQTAANKQLEAVRCACTVRVFVRLDDQEDVGFPIEISLRIKCASSVWLHPSLGQNKGYKIIRRNDNHAHPRRLNSGIGTPGICNCIWF